MCAAEYDDVVVGGVGVVGNDIVAIGIVYAVADVVVFVIVVVIVDIDIACGITGGCDGVASFVYNGVVVDVGVAWCCSCFRRC